MLTSRASEPKLSFDQEASDWRDFSPAALHLGVLARALSSTYWAIDCTSAETIRAYHSRQICQLVGRRVKVFSFSGYMPTNEVPVQIGQHILTSVTQNALLCTDRVVAGGLAPSWTDHADVRTTPCWPRAVWTSCCASRCGRSGAERLFRACVK